MQSKTWMALAVLLLLAISCNLPAGNAPTAVESSQAADADQLSPLFAPEGVSGDLEHLEGHGLVGDGHVVAHEKLAKARCESQEELLLIRFDLVLPGRESVQVLLEGGMLHVVHDGRLHLHSSHVSCPVQNICLQ